MKCYNHPEGEAVAVCRSCGRALCRACITEVGLSSSCKGRCESVVATMNDLVERGRTAYQKSSALQLRNGIFIVVLGMAFLILGIIPFTRGQASEWTYFLILVGVLFAGMGVVQFYYLSMCASPLIGLSLGLWGVLPGTRQRKMSTAAG